MSADMSWLELVGLADQAPLKPVVADPWAFIMQVARHEHPYTSDLTFAKWRTRGVPYWLRAAVMVRASQAGLDFPLKAFRGRRVRAFRPRRLRSTASSSLIA